MTENRSQEPIDGLPIGTWVVFKASDREYNPGVEPGTLGRITGYHLRGDDNTIERYKVVFLTPNLAWHGSDYFYEDMFIPLRVSPTKNLAHYAWELLPSQNQETPKIWPNENK